MSTIESLVENSNKLTIITAKKTINSLYDYLHIKGLYLHAKIKPEDNYLTKEKNVAFIVDFLDSTNLRYLPFWTSLERDVKMVAARYITLRDESNMTLISSSRSKEAGIFILLSGRGELVTVSKDSAGNSTAKLQHGAVVGPLDLFNAEKEDPDVSVTYKTTVNAGSVLQLKYMDLFRAKYGDQNITVNPDEGMTAEEISVRNVASYGESRLSPAMYQFLKKSNLLATSDKDVAYKYIKNGSIGRSIPGKKMQNELIVILDGSIRLVYGQGNAVEQSNKSNNNSIDSTTSSTFGDIKCTQSGEKSAIFKIQQFPLSIIENGAILHLDEKILTLAAGDGSGGGAGGGMGGAAAGGGGDLDTEDVVSLSGAEPAASSLSAHNGYSSQQQQQQQQQQQEVDHVQHISLQFDKPTTYLSIPLKRFRNALQNETHRVNIDIRQEVNEVGRGLASRLDKLRPLLGGGYVFAAGKEARQEEQVDDDQNEVTYNGDITSGDSSLAGSYGIFSKLECKLGSSDKTSILK